MRRTRNEWLALALLVLPLPLAACGGSALEAEGQEPAVTTHVKVNGAQVTRVTLTAAAAKRLGVRTAVVQSHGAGTSRMAIPYDAVLYDPDGETWTYTSPEPLAFQRADIRIARIDGKFAILTNGPPVGTRVVTAGASEIWGVEYGGVED
jgi:hypothetical protein